VGRTLGPRTNKVGRLIRYGVRKFANGEGEDADEVNWKKGCAKVFGVGRKAEPRETGV